MNVDPPRSTATIVAPDRAPAVPRPRQDAASEFDVEAVMTGVIAWLARRELPPGRRRRHHLAAERFLCWYTGQRPWPTARRHQPVHHDLEQSLPRYLASLRRSGHGLAELAMVEAGVHLLRRYLGEGVDQGPPPRRG